MTPRFRYALGLPLPKSAQAALSRTLAARSQNLCRDDSAARRQSEAPLFLDLATLAQTDIPHPFLRQRVTAAFSEDLAENGAGILPASFEITFARLAAHQKNAALFPGTSANIFQYFTALLIPALATQSVAAQPIQRPHLLLPEIPAPRAALRIPYAFTPETLSLIECDQLNGAHRILQKFPLPAPAQPSFPFATPLAA